MDLTIVGSGPENKKFDSHAKTGNYSVEDSFQDVLTTLSNQYSEVLLDERNLTLFENQENVNITSFNSLPHLIDRQACFTSHTQYNNLIESIVYEELIDNQNFIEEKDDNTNVLEETYILDENDSIFCQDGQINYALNNYLMSPVVSRYYGNKQSGQQEEVKQDILIEGEHSQKISIENLRDLELQGKDIEIKEELFNAENINEQLIQVSKPIELNVSDILSNYKKTENSFSSSYIIDQLKVNLSKITPESNRITIQLHPQELGAIEIEVQFNNNTIQAMIVKVEKLDVYNFLNQDISSLKNVLNDLGFEIPQNALNLNLEQNHHQKHQDQSHTGKEAFIDTIDITHKIITDFLSNHTNRIDIII